MMITVLQVILSIISNFKTCSDYPLFADKL